MRRILMVFLAAVLVLLASGCANRAVLYTEQGLEAVEQVWDAEYYRHLDECRGQYAPRTPEAEVCFGSIYDLDAKIGIAVSSAVAVLRAYWTARALGEDGPSWSETIERVRAILDALPLEIQERFDRVAKIRRR